MPALSTEEDTRSNDKREVERIARAPATLPMSPSRASTSRTSVPLPTPPMDGLHDISPMVSSFCVSSSVFAPARAEPAAASQPA